MYRAHDLNLNRYVAVKVLRREKANEVNTRRFLREAELNGSLSGSPYIVSVYDFGRTRGGTLFIVMELLRGRPLNELLDDRINAKKPFTVMECIHIMSPVLRGLHAAHMHVPSIVHRDLKPDNVWLVEEEKRTNQQSTRPSDHIAKVSSIGGQAQRARTSAEWFLLASLLIRVFCLVWRSRRISPADGLRHRDLR